MRIKINPRQEGGDVGIPAICRELFPLSLPTATAEEPLFSMCLGIEPSHRKNVPSRKGEAATIRGDAEGNAQSTARRKAPYREMRYGASRGERLRSLDFGTVHKQKAKAEGGSVFTSGHGRSAHSDGPASPIRSALTAKRYHTRGETSIGRWRPKCRVL